MAKKLKTMLILTDDEGNILGIIPKTKSKKELKNNITNAISNSMNNEATGISFENPEIGKSFEADMWVDKGTTQEIREYYLTETTVYDTGKY